MTTNTVPVPTTFTAAAAAANMTSVLDHTSANAARTLHDLPMDAVEWEDLNLALRHVRLGMLSASSTTASSDVSTHSSGGATWDAVVGLANIKRRLRRLLHFASQPHLLGGNIAGGGGCGLPAPRGILIYGSVTYCICSGSRISVSSA
jgi:hypothetical protein